MTERFPSVKSRDTAWERAALGLTRRPQISANPNISFNILQISWSVTKHQYKKGWQACPRARGAPASQIGGQAGRFAVLRWAGWTVWSLRFQSCRSFPSGLIVETFANPQFRHLSQPIKAAGLCFPAFCSTSEPAACGPVHLSPDAPQHAHGGDHDASVAKAVIKSVAVHYHASFQPEVYANTPPLEKHRWRETGGLENNCHQSQREMGKSEGTAGNAASSCLTECYLFQPRKRWLPIFSMDGPYSNPL